jgi:hypothetical protein
MHPNTKIGYGAQLLTAGEPPRVARLALKLSQETAVGATSIG